MSKLQTTPNTHKTSWPAVIAMLVLSTLIGAVLVECADRQIRIEQAAAGGSK